MPNQNEQKLKPVRKGWIRLSDILPTTQNRQIKIGSFAYHVYVNARNRDLPKTNKIIKETKQLKRNAYFYEKGFEQVRNLIKKRHTFTDEDKKLTKEILTNIGTFGKYCLNFKLRGQGGFENKCYTLRKRDKIRSFVNVLSQGYFTENQAVVGSDALEEIINTGIEDVRLLPVQQKKLFKNKGVNFFRYFNTTDIDLTDLQILREDDDIKYLNESCFIYALEKCGIDKNDLSHIKNTFNVGSYFPRNKMKGVCDYLKTNINLTWYDAKNAKRSKMITTDYKDTINLGMYEDHIFINNVSQFTRFSIENYNIVKDLDNFNNISRYADERKTTFKRLSKTKKIDFIEVVHILFLNNHFYKDPLLMTYEHQYQKYKDKTEYLDNIDNEQELVEFKADNEPIDGCDFQKPILEKQIFYADTECDVKTEDRHIPILLGVLKDGKNMTTEHVRIFTNEDNDKKFFMNFLDYINNNSKNKDAVVYFHNLKYDYTVLQPYLYLCDAPCEKDGQYYSIKILHKKRVIELRDSYKLAPMPLSQFRMSFDLPKNVDKKEAIAYTYHTIGNLKDEKVKMKKYIKSIKKEMPTGKIKEMVKVFKNTIKNNKFNMDYEKDNENEYFNPTEYYKYYLKYDCLVLGLGLQKFKSIIDTISNNNLNLFDSLTISSLTNKYMTMNGCFDGLYKVKGNLRNFLSNAITGGRVQVNPRFKKQIINEDLADYDAVSLYPSAIHRLCKEKGLPMGKCKRIDDYDYNIIKNYSYSVLKVLITKINKYQDLPMVSYKDDESILRYTNNIKHPITAYLDIYTIEDWVKFQGIEFTILDGVYWNEGYNTKMGEVIEHLFNERLRYKKEGNDALQLVLKLMMNSSYGKTIIKKSMKEKTVINQKQKESYINNNFYLINDYTELPNGQIIVNKDSTDDTYNLAFVGIMILSYSKRIMNEVFDTANKLKCPLYYTDTDSIHCNYDDVSKIEEQFKIDYERELNGKQLGQLHIDFDIKENGEKVKCDVIKSIKSIFLSKKCYIDILEGVRTDNKEKIYDVHYRLKGVNTSAILHKAEEYKGDIFKVYESLITATKDDKVKFYLNPEGYKPLFDFKDNIVKTFETGKFTRDIYFDD